MVPPLGVATRRWAPLNEAAVGSPVVLLESISDAPAERNCVHEINKLLHLLVGICTERLLNRHDLSLQLAQTRLLCFGRCLRTGTICSESRLGNRSHIDIVLDHVRCDPGASAPLRHLWRGGAVTEDCVAVRVRGGVHTLNSERASCTAASRCWCAVTSATYRASTCDVEEALDHP